MKNKTRQNLAITLVCILILLTFILGVLIVKQKIAKQEAKNHCIIKNSPEHQIRFAFDYYLAKTIIKSGNQLGSYFDYKFCDEVQE